MVALTASVPTALLAAGMEVGDVNGSTQKERGKSMTSLRILLAASMLAAAPVVAQNVGDPPTARDVSELTAIFRQIDLDRNGKLTKVEMSAFGQRHGLGVLVKDKGWKALDANRDNQVNLPEFINGMVAYRNESLAAKRK